MATMLLYCLLSLIALGTWRLLNIGRRESHLPPGPATVPIFGNALQIPMTGLGKKSVLPLRICRSSQSLKQKCNADEE